MGGECDPWRWRASRSVKNAWRVGTRAVGLACQVPFEPLPGQGEQFRCGGQIPVGGRVGVAWVGGQQGQLACPQA